MIEALAASAIKAGVETLAVESAKEISGQAALEKMQILNQPENFRVGEVSNPEICNKTELKAEENNAIESIQNKLSLFEKDVPKTEKVQKPNSYFDDSNYKIEKTAEKPIADKTPNDISNELKESGWSDEIVNNIGSLEEYEIYKNAGLVEVEIGGKKCLIRNDIDWNKEDAFGRTNQERAEQGLSPLDNDGKPIELHHIGQHADSPLAELKQEEHRGKENDSILHNKNKETEIDRISFANERSQHWRARVKEGEA